MLRRIILALSVLGLLVMIWLFATGQGSATAVYAWFAAELAVVVIGFVAERGRYRSPGSSTGQGWEPTAERFQDPTTGQWTAVEYNPRTGERRYVPEKKS